MFTYPSPLQFFIAYHAPEGETLMVNFISEVESYDSECSVKRCLAAAVIVLAWTKVLTSVVSHPSLEGNPTVILTIFYRFGH